MPQEFVKAAEVGDLKPGQMKLVRIAGERILLCNYDGRIYAVNGACTHEDGMLSRGLLYEHEVACPLHGATFDVRTGEVTALPAVVSIDTFKVRVEDGDVEIEV